MSSAKPVTERVSDLRAHRAMLGLKRLEVYAHPEDHAAIKLLAAKLLKLRAESR